MVCKHEHLLDVQNLSVSFKMYDRGLVQKELKVISDLSVSVDRGEILAVVGSSGSGKSLLAHAIMGILPENAAIQGAMKYQGEDMTPEYQEKLRGRQIALVPQSVTYLDPLMRVEKQVLGAGKDAKKKIPALKGIFNRLELDESVGKQYPYQLSGGMARRVLVSTAVIGDAELVIADEPTPGMQTGQAIEALRIFRELADEGKGVLLITHDIDLALNFADKIAVFYAGTTLELASSGDFLSGEESLRHPYSKALWRAMPQNGFEPLDGFQPFSGSLPSGCLFSPRCSMCEKQCRQKIPEMRELRGGFVRCFHAT
ncbi:MAG: ABC transporter ATP-binding protein [Clostridiales bacterium]|nr:ABC transporter ATP-binding protein [Clostridiales bacterium]